jgi:hypothetical protein
MVEGVGTSLAMKTMMRVRFNVGRASATYRNKHTPSSVAS